MPIYEYECNNCGMVFEFLHGFNDEPRCPKCGNKDLTKKISAFNASGDKGGSSSSSSCGCTPPPASSCG